MRVLVVVLAVLAVGAVACGGGSSGGGGSSSSSSGGSSSSASDSGDGNRCVFTTDLASHDGDMVLLCGQVAASEYLPDQKRNTVLYFDAPPPGETAKAVLEGAIRASFLTKPEERFGAGKLVCAEGKVSIVDGVPQVFVNNAQNIVFLDDLVVTGSNHCNGAGTN